MASFEEENKDERLPINTKNVTRYVDISKNLDYPYSDNDIKLDQELLHDPLVAQLPKAMLKYVKSPKEHQSYVEIHRIYIFHAFHHTHNILYQSSIIQKSYICISWSNLCILSLVNEYILHIMLFLFLL